MAAKSALVGEKASSMDSIPRDVTDSIFEVIKTWAEIDETEAKKEKGRKWVQHAARRTFPKFLPRLYGSS